MKRFLYFFIFLLLISIITFAPVISPIWAETIIASPITQNTIVPETQTETPSKTTTTYTATQTSTSNYITTQSYYNSDEYEYFYDNDDDDDAYEQPLYSITTEYEEESAAAEIASNSTTRSTTTTQTTSSTTTTQTALSTTENNSNSSFSDPSFFNLLGTGIEIAGINTNIIGIIIWCLITAGLVTVLIILFKNKRSNMRGTIIGKTRYKRSASKSKAKHLLNDKYYSKYK